MPQNITDADTFDDPVTAPAGSDVRSSANMLTLLQGYANRTRYLYERMFETTPPSRTMFIPASAAAKVDAVGSAVPWRYAAFGTAPTAGSRLQSNVNLGSLIWTMEDHFRSGTEVTEVRVILQPGAARTAQSSTPGDNGRAYAYWYEELINITDLPEATPANVISMVGPNNAIEQAGTTDVQALTMSSLELAVEKQSFLITGDVHVRNLHVQFIAGSDAGTNRDFVHGLLVTYKDPGIRNY